MISRKLILAVGLLIVSGSIEVHAQIPAGLAGRWAGAAIYNGTPKLFELEFSLDGDSLTTILTQPYSGYSRFPYAFRYEDGRLISGLYGDEMNLVVDLDQGNLRGTVVEGGEIAATVFLQKVLSYSLPAFRDEEVTFTAGDDTLAASLLLPPGDGPFPAVVFVVGRSYTNRYGMYNWAQVLARHGIAGLVFDARGTGRSTGDKDSVTSVDRIEDVRAAFQFVRGRPDVMSDRIGLMSNSAGGWIVPVVAAERDDVAFVVTLVGPAESLADQQGHVIVELMRRSGEAFTRAEYEAAFDYQKRLVDLSAEGAPWSTFEPFVQAARLARWAKYVDLPESLDNSELDYYRRRTDYDPTEALRTIRVPFLAVYGEDDFVVPPGENVPKLRRLLEEAGNDDFEIVILPGADHGMAFPPGFVGEGDWPDRYYSPWTRAPDLLPKIVGWILPRVGSTTLD